MNATVSVRRFRTGDFDRILLIERASFGEDAYDRNLFAKLHERCGELFLVAEHQGKVCGYIVCCPYRRKKISGAELVSVAVDPAARGMGVASRLLDSTLRRLRRRDIGRLNLMVRPSNAPARALYDRYGFRRVRVVRDYYDRGGDGLMMRLLL